MGMILPFHGTGQENIGSLMDRCQEALPHPACCPD
jgi:hypothetical protein